jgi:OOP family OmpA-OmpF porin
MRALLIALILALVGWIGGGSWYWVCKVKGHCGEGTTANESSLDDETNMAEREPNPFIVTYQSRPFIQAPDNFRFSQSSPEGEIPGGVKTALDSMANYLMANPEIDVEITGQFSEGEDNPSGFSNLGLARADYLSQLLAQNGLDQERIIKSYEILDQEKAFANQDYMIGGLKLRLLDRIGEGQLAANDSEDSITSEGNTESDTPNTTDETTNAEEEDSDASNRRIAELATPTPRDLYFGFNSYNLAMDDELRDYISRSIQFLKQNEDKKLVLTGHTDDIGESASNIELGQNRAQTVKKFFEEFGLSSSQIQATSKGEAQPIADNDSEAGRSKNRRVEIRIE